MRILQTSLILLVSLVTVASGQVSSVSWSAQNPGSGLGAASGGELAAGSLVRLGCFDLTPEQVRQLSGDVESLEKHFREISSATIGSFGATTRVLTGAFSQVVSIDPLDDDRELVGCRAYIWAMNAGRADDATEHAIFSRAEWTFPSDQFSVPQWGIEQVSPDAALDVYIASRSETESATVGGPLNSLLPITRTDDGRQQRILERAFGENSVGHREFLTEGETEGTYGYQRLSGGQDLLIGGYASGGLAYIIEVSEDLEVWRRSDIEMLSATPVEGTEYEYVAFQPSLDGGDERYVRIRVTEVE